MKTLVVTILEHETSRPLSGLLVTWYLTAERNIPAAYLEPSKWAELKKAGWAELKPARIGSAVTANTGSAVLTFDDKSHDDVRRLNVWFTVQLPEVVGSKSCNQIVYAACEIRQTPAEYEEFITRIPRDLVQEYTIGLNSFTKLTANLSLADVTVELMKLEPKPAIRGRRAPAFSKVFNERIAEAKKKTDESLGVRVRPVAVFLPVPFVAGGNVTGNSGVSFDAETKKLVVKRRGSNKELSFEGIRRYTNQRLTAKKFARPRIEVDVDSGKTQIALPRVPDQLELSETNPTRLFSFSSPVVGSKDGER